jgi:hypothetical protein
MSRQGLWDVIARPGLIMASLLFALLRVGWDTVGSASRVRDCPTSESPFSMPHLLRNNLDKHDAVNATARADGARAGVRGGAEAASRIGLAIHVAVLSVVGLCSGRICRAI